MAYEACAPAAATPMQGSIGAGTGATVGKIIGADRCSKGGLGLAAADRDGLMVRALAVVNALVDVRNARGDIIAGAHDADGSWLHSAAFIARGRRDAASFAAVAARNTAPCVVATNAALDRPQLAARARATPAALYRPITPVGTLYDGDVVFATAPRSGGVGVDSSQLEVLAVMALEQAIERAVATSTPGEVRQT